MEDSNSVPQARVGSVRDNGAVFTVTARRGRGEAESSCTTHQCKEERWRLAICDMEDLNSAAGLGLA
ncbi:hypothetical protein KCP69_20795 [Salmonella enterica subsp. enterica]|nr:hypothetical protein KCP69_20795 [Salmonella enterica subsp. enterica]